MHIVSKVLAGAGIGLAVLFSRQSIAGADPKLILAGTIYGAGGPSAAINFLWNQPDTVTLDTVAMPPYLDYVGGCYYMVSFQYYNAGTKDIVVADPSDWRTWEYVALKTDSGPPPGGTLLTTMPPGALFGGGVSVPVTSGNHLLFLDVNYQNRVPDDDYSNNSGALNIKVVGPGC